MKRLINLNGRKCRASLDGVYYSSNIILNNIEIQNSELAKEKLNRILEETRKVFNFYTTERFPHKTGFTLESTKRLGIYIKFTLQKRNISINVQFKGYYFTFDHAWYEMRCKMCELMIKLKVFFRPTLIDIAQDFAAKTYEVLPYPTQENLDKGLSYNFKYKVTFHNEKTKDDKLLDTGFVLQNSRFKLKLYDKKRENEKSTNLAKKHYYEDFFKEYEDTSRVEISLKQESCKRFWLDIFTTELSIEEYALYLFKHFGNNHSARIKPKGSKDKDKSRWPKLENWVYIFDRSEYELNDIPTINDLRFTKSNLTREKVFSDFVELISNEKDISLETIIREITLWFPKIIQSIHKKRVRREYTQKHLKELLEKVLSTGIELPEEVGIL
jgi:hypothetical protein